MTIAPPFMAGSCHAFYQVPTGRLDYIQSSRAGLLLPSDILPSDKSLGYYRMSLAGLYAESASAYRFHGVLSLTTETVFRTQFPVLTPHY